MKRTHLVVISLGLVAVLALASCAVPGPYQQPYPYGSGGMMGPGMMGPGMMGGLGGYNPNGKQITIDAAAGAVERYLRTYYGRDLALAEVMEFNQNFYAEVEEEDTGIHAMELLIDKYTGQVYPETGPNMMWNAKYGMMSGMMWGTLTPSGPMTVTEEAAKGYAEEFLKSYLPGAKVGDADRFYGYYTIEILSNDQIYGMLSVNGYTGQVWYHSWHGAFIAMKELS